MKAVNQYVSTRCTRYQRVSSAWRVSSLALVLALFAGCMPVQPAVNSPSQQPTTFEGLSTGLDNAKQARIRVTSMLIGGPNVDVFINGLPVVNSGRTLQNLKTGQFSGWIYVTPGTYLVTLVPHAGTLTQALFAPASVKAEAGHHYTVGQTGQLQANNVKPVVVDETALLAEIDAKATENIAIDINNLTGADGVDELAIADGQTTTASIKYGQSVAYRCPGDNPHFKSTVTGVSTGILGEGDDKCEPAISYTILWFGHYPDNVGGGSASQGTSELPTLDFLNTFNRHQVRWNGHLMTFNIVLAAIEKAGLRDLLANSGPYLFLAPTDEAFAALPKAQLDTLLNDPQALTTLLKTQFVEGYYPSGSLSGATGEGGRELTNLLGQKLTMEGDSINGQDVGGPSYVVANGNRIGMIYKLLSVK